MREAGNKREKTIGFIGTTVYHGVLFLLLAFFMLKAIPPEEDEGILINFGDSPTGMGASEPARNMPSVAQTTPPPAQSAPARPVATPPPPPAAAPRPTPRPAREPLLTQNVEPAPAISAQERARVEAERQRQSEEQRRQQEINRQRQAEEQQRQQELERQRQIEAEQARQQELERQRQAEEEARRQQEQQRQAQAARNAANRAFSNTQGAGEAEGEVAGAGNQGRLTGDPNATQRAGSGLGSSGNSFSLSGRSLQGALPPPNYSVQEQGVVVVEITVDRNGVVTNAQPILRGTTTQNAQLWREAREAALRARFNSSPNAPAVQMGTITYHFVLR